MTKQEVFNKVWNHIITQGEPSVDELGNCVYRGPFGLKCAAGIFLTNKQAEKLDEKDGGIWFKAVQMFPKLEKFPNMLIMQLQECHDYSSSIKDNDKFVEEFKSKAKKVAEKHNLTVPKETA